MECTTLKRPARGLSVAVFAATLAVMLTLPAVSEARTCKGGRTITGARIGPITVSGAPLACATARRLAAAVHFDDCETRVCRPPYMGEDYRWRCRSRNYQLESASYRCLGRKFRGNDEGRVVRVRWGG